MEMELDLKELLLVLLRKIWAILTVTLIGGLAAFLFTYFCVSPMYTASISMYVYNRDQNSTNFTVGDVSSAARLVDTYIVVLRSDTLLAEISERMDGAYSPGAIRGMMSAASINETEAFKVSITNSDPVVAQTIANLIGEVAPAEILRVVKVGDATVIDPAPLPTYASWPVRGNTIKGMMAGFALASAFFILRHLMDLTVHSEEDLTRHYEYPVLGMIPTIHGIVDKTKTEDKAEQQTEQQAAVADKNTEKETQA